MSSYRTLGVRLLSGICLLVVGLAACGPATGTPPSIITLTNSPTPTITITPTSVPSATPTPRTPPVLPVPYINNDLTPYGSPHSYIQDECLYLQDKWSSKNSPPGTVVMTIMFHSIVGGEVTNPNQMSEFKLRSLMNKLHEEGFSAINTTQMADFMEHNAKIPERSVLLVVDDRHFGKYFDLYFRQYWTKYGWPVVNAWISLDDANGQAALPDNIALEKEGWVDHQAHGFIHNIPIGTGFKRSIYSRGTAETNRRIPGKLSQDPHCRHLAGGRILAAGGRSCAPIRLPAGIYDQPARTGDVQLGAVGGYAGSCAPHLDPGRPGQ